MLIIDKIKQTHFSNAENIIVEFITQNSDKILNLTTQEIARETHTNPTSLIRVAKKLGFTGWTDFKQAYHREWLYSQENFDAVDANLPFNKDDSVLTIANKIGSLEQQTIQDTMELFDNTELEKARQLLVSAESIQIYGSFTNSLIANDFVTKMRRIGVQVDIPSNYDDPRYVAARSGKDQCAIVISYTGSNEKTLEYVNMLHKRSVPIISITSVGNNPIAEMSNSNLHITTREHLTSKIGNFTTNIAIIFILDVLYSIVFAEDYSKNFETYNL